MKVDTPAIACAAFAGRPLLTVPVVLAAARVTLEDRFNKTLLFDLVARPASRPSGAVRR